MGRTPPPKKRDSNGLDGSNDTSRLLLFLGILLLVLAVLFYRSFLPGQIPFANDGPLGAMQAENSHYPAVFSGHWVDLTWLGFETPSAAPSITGLVATLCSSKVFLKIFAPAGLALLGFSVWLLFRQLRFHPMVCLLGGLAAALNMHFFSVACWGLGTWNVATASIFLGLAALCSPNIRQPWARAALAGMAIGMGVMEGFDMGAILSLFAGLFSVFTIWNGPENTPTKVARSVWMPLTVVAFAIFIAIHTVTGLVKTQIEGVGASNPDGVAKVRAWDFATQWSVPKVETLRLFIPGIFGYRLDGYIHDNTRESAYWGRIGEEPNLERVQSPDPEVRRQVAQTLGLRSDYAAALTNSDPSVWTPVADFLKPHMMRRHTGSGEYAGILVAVLAAFGVASAFRKVGNAFQPAERRAIWFWAAAALLAILLAWGRHGFLYKYFYQLPYLSTIRGPYKFLCPFHVAWIILAGYGMEALWRGYIKNGPVSSDLIFLQVQRWRAKAAGFDKRWDRGLALALASSIAGLLILFASRTELQHYLVKHDFAEAAAPGMVDFCCAEVMWHIVSLGASAVTVLAIMSGAWAGRRAGMAWIALGALLVVDLGRSDWRWLEYYDFDLRYMTNPVVEFLKDKPWEHRVTAELLPRTRQSMASDSRLYGLYFDILQNQFPYWNIQSLDVSQMPRDPDFDKAYFNAFRLKSMDDVFPCLRFWQLTNTRYVLGSSNNPVSGLKFDEPQGFRPRLLFDAAVKPGIQELTVIDQLTYVETTNGPFALFELTNALPRAKLYSNWRVMTNDAQTLETLVSRDFDPAALLLVSGETPVAAPAEPGADPGSVEITRYKSQRVTLRVEAAASAILLLNDRIAPQWRTYVDGKPAPLLRCNYIMRGVQLEKGRHEVQFRFEPPLTTLYISLSAWVAAILIGAATFAANRPRRASATVPKT